MLSKLFNALEKTRFSLLGAFKNIKQGKISLDDLEKKVIYEPVKLSQEFRDFDSESPWEGMKNNLIGDEKSEIQKD